MFQNSILHTDVHTSYVIIRTECEYGLWSISSMPIAQWVGSGAISWILVDFHRLSYIFMIVIIFYDFHRFLLFFFEF